MLSTLLFVGAFGSIASAAAVPAAPALSVELTQVNATTINATLINPTATDVILFAQNSIFDGAVQQSIQVLNSTGAILAYGDDAEVSFYTSVTTDDLVSLNASSSWTLLFDVTTFYQIPAPGKYSVVFTGSLPVVGDPTDLSDLTLVPTNFTSTPLIASLGESAAATTVAVPAASSDPPSPYVGGLVLPAGPLPPLDNGAAAVTSPAAGVPTFVATPERLAKRTWSNSNCSPADQAIVEGMLTVAQQYAADGVLFMEQVARQQAFGAQVHPIWQLYFNNDDTTTVAKAFQKISAMNFAANDNIDIYCRQYPLPTSKPCRAGVGARTRLGPPASITLCDAWFSLPESLNCDAKAPSTVNQQPADMPNTLLHELLHVPFLVKAKIGDGPNPARPVYSYTDVTAQALAQTRWGGLDYAPQDTASAYVYFLYSCYQYARQIFPSSHPLSNAFGTCVLTPYAGGNL